MIHNLTIYIIFVNWVVQPPTSTARNMFFFLKEEINKCNIDPLMILMLDFLFAWQLFFCGVFFFYPGGFFGTGVIKWDPNWGKHTSNKCIVILSDLHIITQCWAW